MEILQLLREFGFPTALIVVAGLGLWTALRWLAKHVVRPLIVSHVSLVNHLKHNAAALKTQSESHANLLTELVAMERLEHDEQREFRRDWTLFRSADNSQSERS